MKATITTRDKGYNRLLRRAQAISGAGQLSVGIHPREGRRRYTGGQTVAQVARWHETGTKRMPARPFVFYWWVRENGQRKVRDTTRRALQASLANGTDPTRALQRAGERYVAEIRTTFDLMKPIAISTAKRKRSRQVLVETGLLWRSVGYRVRVGGRRPVG